MSYQARGSSGAKNVKDITISKVFTILNLLTFDGVKYMENGDLCCGACMDRLHLKQISSPLRMRSSNHPGAFGHVKEAQLDTLQDAHALEHSMIV